jgi:Right handed beta helix region
METPVTLKINFRIFKLAAFSLIFFAASISHAKGRRVYVSLNGNDSNKCTERAPCRTFQHAIDSVKGSVRVIALTGGEFEPVDIRKSVSLIGNQSSYATITTRKKGEPGIYIQTGLKTIVNLRYLRIEGKNHEASGIEFRSGGELQIADCELLGGFPGNFAAITIKDFAKRVIIQHTTIDNKAFGINIRSQGGSALIEDSRILNNDNAGILVGAGANLTIRGTIFMRNGVAVWETETPQACVIESCEFDGNTLAIRAATSDRRSINVKDTKVHDNGKGLDARNFGRLNVYGSSITKNAEGLVSEGSGIICDCGQNKVADNGTNGSFTRDCICIGHRKKRSR